MADHNSKSTYRVLSSLVENYIHILTHLLNLPRCEFGLETNPVPVHNITQTKINSTNMKTLNKKAKFKHNLAVNLKKKFTVVSAIPFELGDL